MDTTKNKFEIGDEALCLKHVDFVESLSHLVGGIYKVTEENVDYFNVNAKSYSKVIKTFKTFNPDLFKAYINKFSEEDILEAYNILQGKVSEILNK